MLRLHTLGGLALVDEAGTVVATQRRRLALLAVLGVAGKRGLTRDKLVAYFWPERPTENARHALEQLLYAVRRQLGDELFLGADPLRLNPDLIESDVGQFGAAVAEGAYPEAVAQYGGPFLDGFFLNGADAFERWTETERARLSGEYGRVLRRLARNEADVGNYVAEVQWRRRLVALEPLAAQGALDLMRALVASGDRASALQHARVYEALVRQELSSPPDEQVTAMVNELQVGRAPAAAASDDGQTFRGEFVGGAVEMVTPKARAQQRGVRRWPIVLTTGLTGLIALGLAAKIVLRDRLSSRGVGERIQSIAVLPLRNLSGDSAQAYFAAGMTEALVTSLGKTSGLRVISLTSAMSYQGTHVTLPTIARQLNVDAVVEGAVLRGGNRVRVTAQLVEASSDRHLWAETYEGSLQDVLELQDEIARAITTEVLARVSTPARGTLSSNRARPVNPDAYDLYLKGRYEWNDWTEQGLKRSIEYFEQAVQKDPSYAPAWAGLSDAYSLMGFFGFWPSEVALSKAKPAALRAIQLDETLSEAHVSLSGVYLHLQWSWSAAEKELRRAIALDPNNAMAHQWYGYYLSATVQVDSALVEMRRALELDPLSPNKQSSLAGTFYRGGRYDEALELFRQVPDADVNSESRHRRIAAIYERKGMLNEALGEWRTGLRLAGKHQLAALLERTYLASGYAEAKRALLWADLRERERQASHAYPRPLAIDIAADYALLGERGKAFEWLDRAVRDREGYLMWLKVDDRFEALRSDPRFRVLLRRIGLWS